MKAVESGIIRKVDAGGEDMKAIHAHIFQDVYERAGQERTAPVGQFMTKGGRAYYGAGTALCARGCLRHRKAAEPEGAAAFSAR